MRNHAFTKSQLTALIIYCKRKFGTTNVPVIKVIKTLTADANKADINANLYLDIFLHKVKAVTVVK